MASYTSWRWTGTSFGATMPSRTLSPRISTTVTVMSLLITMLSFFFLDSTSIAAYPSLGTEGGYRDIGSHATRTNRSAARSTCAGEDPLPLQEPTDKSHGGGRYSTAAESTSTPALL